MTRQRRSFDPGFNLEIVISGVPFARSVRPASSRP
ncbi:MAG: hypothetical protein JWQ23_1229 [Herminiimonas sp.]|nr:hypothetical protein [Herminiimonas sp.]